MTRSFPSFVPDLRRTDRLVHTLRFRLMLSVALVHVILMGVFVADAVKEQSSRIEAELYNRGHSLVTLTAVASANALLTEDLGALAEIVQRVKNEPDVMYSEVLDSRGYVLGTSIPGRLGKRLPLSPGGAEYSPVPAGHHALELHENIRIADHTVGTVSLGLSTARMDAAVAQTWRNGALFILLALVVGSAAAWALSLAATRGLRGLMDAVRGISRGDFDVQVPVRSRDEVGILGMAFNTMVASLKRASREAAQEHERRTQAERLACVGEMSASIAHEIRNPLSAIINSVKLLSADSLSLEERAQVISIVNLESGRLNRILGDFLDFAKIRESEPVKADLTQIIEEIADMLRKDLPPGRRIQVAVQCAPEARFARFDRDQMRQVLWNLMLNGVQAMPDGGTLSLRTGRERDKVSVSVADTGRGIPAELVKDVTKPFVTGRKEGTGLGLAIVQRILVQHDTQLSIVSHEGVGTDVSFQLDAGE